MGSQPHIIILGAGLAGLGAAYELARNNKAAVTVVEQNETVGGISGSFHISGLTADYGSHRLHPACDPEILNDIKFMLGDELLDRPRNGRIRLRERWIRFPLKPLDLAFGLPAGFSANVMRDILSKLFKKNSSQSGDETFASILESGLGPTICREFYFPYTRKIWGLPPEELSPIQAYRRVSSNTLNKMFLKIVSAVPGFKTSGSGRFFYPAKGFGQIGESFYREAMKAGVEFHLGSSVKSLTHNGETIDAICCENKGKTITYQADYVWSTIPVTDLVQSLKPNAPASVLDASRAIQYRQMILIYLVLEQQQFTEYDAHYFPETDIPITRLSEPKHYNNAQEPQNRTILCAELPCSAADPEWSMTDEELAKLMLHCLESAGIPVQAPVLTAVTRRLTHAYPIYLRGYEAYFNEIDNWLNRLQNLLTFGRQGLFVHDNTHHALYMGYSAAKCLNGSDGFDRTQWQEYRKIFNTHVVED